MLSSDGSFGRDGSVVSCVIEILHRIRSDPTRLPLQSGFTGYASRFVDPALGFCLGWNYWFKVCPESIVLPT